MVKLCDRKNWYKIELANFKHAKNIAHIKTLLYSSFWFEVNHK